MRRSVAALGLLLAGVLPCRAGSVEPAADLKDQLLDSAGDQKAAIRALAEKGTPYLASLLKGEGRIVRTAAIMALALVREEDKSAVELLVALCGGKDAEDASFALIALAQRRAPEAKEWMLRFAKSSDPRLRMAVPYAIGECRDRSVYPLLDKLAADDSDPQVQGVARKAKARLEKAGSQPRQPK